MSEFAIIIPIFSEPPEILMQNIQVFGKYGRHVYWALNSRDHVTIGAAQALLMKTGVGFRMMLSPSENNSKANNLNYTVPRIKEDRFMVFDVDNIPSDTYIENVRKNLTDDVGMSLGFNSNYNKDENFITRCQEFELERWNFALRNMMQPRTGGYPQIIGCGFAMRRADFQRIGGLWEETTTEDCDLTFKLMFHGLKTRFVDDIFYGECPTTVWGTIQQRVRWHKGNIQCMLRHGRRAVHENYLLFLSYLWNMYCSVFTDWRMAKYLIPIFCPMPGWVRILLLIQFLGEEFEITHWRLMETMGLLTRRRTYATIVLNLLNVLVPFIGAYQYLRDPKGWYLTPKKGRVH